MRTVCAKVMENQIKSNSQHYDTMAGWLTIKTACRMDRKKNVFTASQLSIFGCVKQILDLKGLGDLVIGTLTVLAFLISSCHKLFTVQYLFSISLKVSSSWPDTALILSFSLMISSSSSSILRWSLLMFISAYSERESDCFKRIWICLIWS